MIRSIRMGRVGTLCGAWVGAAVVLGAAPASAQHAGDVFVGRSLDGRLKIGGYDPALNYTYLIPVTGLLEGWADNDPGFDHVIHDVPEEDLYALDDGASVRLLVEELDPAFRAIDAAFQILDQPGESTLLGDELLHVHLTWHINSEDANYDPVQCVWHATFTLTDSGSTDYADSEPFTFNFTNVEPRVAIGDFDDDLDVDLDDAAALPVCLSGPGVVPAPDDPAITTCEVECLNGFDFDADFDVDLRDAAGLQTGFTG